MDAILAVGDQGELYLLGGVFRANDHNLEEDLGPELGPGHNRADDLEHLWDLERALGLLGLEGEDHIALGFHRGVEADLNLVVENLQLAAQVRMVVLVGQFDDEVAELGLSHVLSVHPPLEVTMRLQIEDHLGRFRRQGVQLVVEHNLNRDIVVVDVGQEFTEGLGPLGAIARGNGLGELDEVADPGNFEDVRPGRSPFREDRLVSGRVQGDVSLATVRQGDATFEVGGLDGIADRIDDFGEVHIIHLLPERC
jgi:hypothetical protein